MDVSVNLQRCYFWKCIVSTHTRTRSTHNSSTYLKLLSRFSSTIKRTLRTPSPPVLVYSETGSITWLNTYIRIIMYMSIHVTPNPCQCRCTVRQGKVLQCTGVILVVEWYNQSHEFSFSCPLLLLECLLFLWEDSLLFFLPLTSPSCGVISRLSSNPWGRMACCKNQCKNSVHIQANIH